MTRDTISRAANHQRCSAASYLAVEKYRENPAGVSRCGQLIHHHQMKHAEHALLARAFLWAALDNRNRLEFEDFTE